MHYFGNPSFSKMILKGQTPVIAARDNAIGGIQRTQLITLHPVRVFPKLTTAAIDKNVILVEEIFFIIISPFINWAFLTWNSYL
jgi:hypothetical protein